MAQIEAIPSELTQFKEALDGKVSLFRTYVSDLENKMNHLKTLSDSMEDAVSRSYTGENKGQVVQKLQKISAIYQKIIDSIDDVGDLSRIFNASETLIGDIKNLEAAKSNLETLDGEISGLQNKNPRTNTEENELSSKTSRFSISHLGYTTSIAQASSSYDTLKGMDSAFFFVTDFSSVDYSTLTQVGGSFTRQSFTASDGTVVDYYIYIPDYGQEVTGLPIHLYLHGSGERSDGGNGVLSTSLPAMIQNGTITPSGIVICPQSTDGVWYNNDRVLEALKELTDEVVEQYSANSDKISMSGHSNGAAGGYRLVSMYPDYFSAFIPISGPPSKMVGYNQGTSVYQPFLNTTKIWLFHGTKDTTDSHGYAYRWSANVYNYLHGKTNNADFESLNAGHSIQNMVFENSYSFNGEAPITPLEWAFEQEKGQ